MPALQHSNQQRSRSVLRQEIEELASLSQAVNDELVRLREAESRSAHGLVVYLVDGEGKVRDFDHVHTDALRGYLQISRGNKFKAAQMAGMNYNAFCLQLKRFGVIYDPSSVMGNPAREVEVLLKEVGSWSGGELPTLDEIQDRYIAFVFARNNGHVTNTANDLGISRGALFNCRRRLGLDTTAYRRRGSTVSK